MSMKYRDAVTVMKALRLPRSVRKHAIRVFAYLRKLLGSAGDILLDRAMVISILLALLFAQIPFVGVTMSLATLACGLVITLIDQVITVLTRRGYYA